MTRNFLLLLLLCVTSHSYSQRLVLPGDYPDPSVVKIGESYWATATTSNWAPAYPILESKDLITWQPKSHVFPKLPDWADFYFWAPEITYDKGKVYVYYSAHKRGGNLCLGIASADAPEGPYTDHGPLMCEEAGSIDAFPMRDESGKLYLIWKEDGNSVKRPTPIWAMELSEDRTKLIGEKVELFRNDAAWEANLVEGVSIIKRGEYYYAFYAGAGCCGAACTYGVGIARAKRLLGPWEKYDKNPLLKSDKDWKCPGHGTPVEHDGKYYFLFHAYDAKSGVYAGRQGVLSEFTFTPDAWIEFRDKETSQSTAVPSEIVDEFNGDTLSPHWQWSVFQKTKYDLSDGKLTLFAQPEKSGAFLGQKTYTADYEAEAVINGFTTTAGLALIGDEKNFISTTIEGNKLVLKKVEADKETILNEKKINAKDKLTLRVSVANGKDISFAYSTNGKDYSTINSENINGTYLPPWDRAVRVGLISRGSVGQRSTFDHFILRNKK
jgi:beta-xylosidase